MLLMTILCAPMISAVLFEGIVGGVFLVSGYYFALNAVRTSGLNST